MTAVSIVRRGRLLIRNKYLYPYWKRTFPLVRYENELSTVCPGKGVKHKTPGQQGKGVGFFLWKRGAKIKDDKVQHMQYLRYLYPSVNGNQLVSEGRNISFFESRLDVVAYHLDWSRTKNSSRQAAGHGHFLVNGHNVTYAGYRLKIGDVLECKKSLPYRFGFKKPYYSSSEVNHRIRAAIFLNPELPCETSVCNVKRKRWWNYRYYNRRQSWKYNRQPIGWRYDNRDSRERKGWKYDNRDSRQFAGWKSSNQKREIRQPGTWKDSRQPKEGQYSDKDRRQPVTRWRSDNSRQPEGNKRNTYFRKDRSKENVRFNFKSNSKKKSPGSSVGRAKG